MKYSLCILKNKNLFKRQISFPKCIEHQTFLDPQLQLLMVFGYHFWVKLIMLSICIIFYVPDYNFPYFL